MSGSMIQGPIDPATMLGAWPSLRLDGHKYHRGHAVIISAGLQAPGAARLAARAALRIGAGLVTVAVPGECLAVQATALTAVMVHQADGPTELASLLADRRRNAVAIGPGLEPDGETRDLVSVVLRAGPATVLDAGALTAFEGRLDDLRSLIAESGVPVVVTPHEGEFARLFPDMTGDRLTRAAAAAVVSRAVVILMGRGTVVAEPNGRIALDRAAPPTLATAGSGDVLTGFVTGLLAQGMAPFEAACVAVWMHGATALRFGPGLIAEDLETQVPSVLAELHPQSTR
jgi:hydroxyethylthiazole kinase-like uncharacterized protein yjeF